MEARETFAGALVKCAPGGSWLTDCRDRVLTGIPRSGSSLFCRLIHGMPDVVALSEPLNVARLGRCPDPEAVCDRLSHYFGTVRLAIRTDRTAISQQIEGRLVDNYFQGTTRPGELRAAVSARGLIDLSDKRLTQNFILVIKHTVAFTASLPALVRRFPCYALIRNPLAVLASWNTVQIPSGVHGRSPMAEAFDRKLAAALSAAGDRVQRQLLLLSWYYQTYDQNLPAGRIVRYEDLIASPEGEIAKVVPASLSPGVKLSNRNRCYEPGSLRVLGERLLQSRGAYWRHYHRDEVAGLLGEDGSVGGKDGLEPS